MIPSLQFFISCLIWITVTYMCHYLIKHFRYYRLAFQLPWMHPYIPPTLVTYLLGPFYKFNVYQILRNNQGCNKDIFGVWFPKLTVIVKKPEYLSAVYSLLEKSVHYEGITYLIGPTGLITAGGDTFRRSKKLFMRDFNGSSQDIILDNIYRGTAKLVETLESKAGQGWFKLGPIIKFVTTNNIMGAAMDITLPEDNSIFKLVEDFDFIMIATLLQTTLGKIPFVSSIAQLNRRMLEGRRLVQTFCEDVNTQKRKDLSEILRKNEEVPNQFIYNVFRDRADDPIENIYADIITIAAAALDTSAGTSSAALVLLGMHPEMQEKVFEEDQRVQKELRGRKMLQSDFVKYEYLQRVIKETLRLYPAIPIVARHVEEELKIGSYTLPVGCSVAVYLPYIHRNPEIYPDPNRFDPDRFLPENVEKRYKYSYLPFSHGQRQCPGRHYAAQSATCIIASIIRKFKVFSKYKSVVEMDDNITGFITICETGGFPARLELRQ